MVKKKVVVAPIVPKTLKDLEERKYKNLVQLTYDMIQKHTKLVAVMKVGQVYIRDGKDSDVLMGGRHHGFWENQFNPPSGFAYHEWYDSDDGALP